MQSDDTEFFLGKFREYVRKAAEATNPGVRAALEAVAKEYLRRAGATDADGLTKGTGPAL